MCTRNHGAVSPAPMKMPFLNSKARILLLEDTSCKCAPMMHRGSGSRVFRHSCMSCTHRKQRMCHLWSSTSSVVPICKGGSLGLQREHGNLIHTDKNLAQEFTYEDVRHYPEGSPRSPGHLSVTAICFSAEASVDNA